MTEETNLKEKALFSFNPLAKGLFHSFQEVFSGKVYERGGVAVREGDVVLDLGASMGDFAFSIRDKKPKHIYCVEPDPSLCELLKINTKGSPVTIIPKAIVGEKDVGLQVLNDQGVSRFPPVDEFETTTFKKLVDDYKIDYIDFLKIDIEGGEYNIFTEENVNFLATKVKTLVCEFHFSDRTKCKNKNFLYFRDNILPQLGNYCVTGVTYKDYSITAEELNYDIKAEGFEENYIRTTIWIFNKADN